MTDRQTVFSGFMVQDMESDEQKQPKSSRATLLLKRTEDRKAAKERRKERTEKLKEEGNNHFRQGHFVEAIAKYNEAIKIDGLRPIIMTNLAAAYLKLEQFELAEWACDCALLHSPSSAKARFRRAIARKGLGMLKGAELDLSVVIKHHPEITEAREGLSQVREERKKSGDGQRSQPAYDEAFPPFDAEEWDPPVGSDSEDAKHTGNGRACRYYNHGGCRNGSLCEYNHAPDDQSVRNDLGRNVCLHFLLGACKFGTRCAYSHSKDHLPQGWWSTPTQVEEAKMLRAVLDDPEAVDDHVIETLENTTAYGRLKKSKDYGEDFKLYSALHSDVLTSRFKDKSSKKLNKPSPKGPSRFVCVLCFEDPEPFTSIHGHLLDALTAKLKVIYARNVTQASTYLKAPELAGVIVSDAGITARSKLNTVSQLVDYVRGGGSVVFGTQFPSFISGSEFDRFFSQHFGLKWKYGSYFRTTFHKNVGNEIVEKNPSLEPSYSMKALHVQGISPESVVYKASGTSRTQSFVFPSDPITDFDESPAVSTKVGKGLVSFLGDVNGEAGSTKTILAMLRLLDSKIDTLPTVTLSTVPQVTPFIMQLSLEDNELSRQFTTRQLQAIKMRMDVKKATTETEALALLSSSNLSGVYVTDPALTDRQYQPLLKRLASYVKDGGRLVIGGTFSCFAKYPHFAPLFAEFGLKWRAAAYTKEDFKLNHEVNELVDENPFLPKGFYTKAVFLGGVEPHDMIYRPAHVTRDPTTPVAFGDAGNGSVGYIGNVNADECATPVLLAMFGLLKHPRPITKQTPRKFVIALVQSGFVDAYRESPLFKQLKENAIEIITDEELSDSRLLDLLSSPDLLGVLAMDESLPEREWLSQEIAAYVWSGGSLIFCGDSAMTPPDEFEYFFTDCFFLPWKISSATKLPVKLNQENELVRRLPQTMRPESVNYEGSFLHDVDPGAVVYSSEPGLGPERAAHVPVAYTTVGKGHVGFFGHEEIKELDTKLVLAMLGLVPLRNGPQWRSTT